MLLDKDGNVVKTVKEHNDSVRADVAKTVGPRLAGLEGAIRSNCMCLAAASGEARRSSRKLH